MRARQSERSVDEAPTEAFDALESDDLGDGPATDEGGQGARVCLACGAAGGRESAECAACSAICPSIILWSSSVAALERRCA